MPLTLQEAQLVSWKIFRKISAKRGEDCDKAKKPWAIAGDLLKEAAEMSRVVNSQEGSGSQEEPKTKEKLAKELNNALYDVFVLAEHYGINLEETFLEHVNDFLLSFLT